MPQGIFDSNVLVTPAVSATGSNGASGIVAGSDSGNGVGGYSSTRTGVDGTGPIGVSGNSYSPNGVGVIGRGATGVSGRGITYDVRAVGVSGTSEVGTGVVGQSTFYIGVSGYGRYVGVQGIAQPPGFAGRFFGNVSVNNGTLYSGDVSVYGTLYKSAGSFKIDHPLDPENKYLSHSVVESPDMLNIYNGIITTNANGDATIILPDYFEALNRDFRYQLTVIGQFAQAIVTEEVRNNQFTIKTDQPNITVSWQVTGVRKDHFANMHRILIEEDKPADERGMYLHPEAHGKPETQSIKSAHEKRLKGP